MKKTLIAIALFGTLAACTTSQDRSLLEVRKGPQKVSPYNTMATNPTILRVDVIR